MGSTSSTAFNYLKVKDQDQARPRRSSHRDIHRILPTLLHASCLSCHTRISSSAQPLVPRSPATSRWRSCNTVRLETLFFAFLGSGIDYNETTSSHVWWLTNPGLIPNTTSPNKHRITLHPPHASSFPRCRHLPCFGRQNAAIGTAEPPLRNHLLAKAKLL